MTTEDKFHAAVNVIRSLPKNGSYQPSHELMLRFYAYYKQATEGPCEKSGTAKPMFWDVVGRAKYTAWQKLGNMSRQTAMDLYVAELLRIVETMSLTDNVATFLSADDAAALGAMPIDDLELISPGVKERVRSQPGSPYASRPSSRPESPEGLYNGVTNQDSDDEYIDSVEHTPELQAPKKTIPNGMIPSTYQNHNGVTNVYPHTTDISNEITKTLAALQADLHTINQRITAVEHRKPKIITFGHLSPLLIGFLLMWPFVAFRIVRAIERKN